MYRYIYIYIAVYTYDNFFNCSILNRSKGQKDIKEFTVEKVQSIFGWLTNRGVVVQEVVEDLGSDGETADQSAGQDGLLRVCDNALLYKFYNTITKHLGMNTQVLVVT